MDKLSQKIADKIFSNSIISIFIEHGWKSPDMLKQEGYAKLADDQSLPENYQEYPPVIDWEKGIEYGYNKSQQVMLKAGWRKVELPE